MLLWRLNDSMYEEERSKEANVTMLQRHQMTQTRANELSSLIDRWNPIKPRAQETDPDGNSTIAEIRSLRSPTVVAPSSPLVRATTTTFRRMENVPQRRCRLKEDERMKGGTVFTPSSLLLLGPGNPVIYLIKT